MRSRKFARDKKGEYITGSSQSFRAIRPFLDYQDKYEGWLELTATTDPEVVTLNCGDGQANVPMGAIVKALRKVVRDKLSAMAGTGEGGGRG